MDRPSAGGFLGLTAFQAEGCGGGFAADFKKGARLRRRLCRRVASLRSGGDSACGAEDCGIALSGDEYKVSVTSLPFCIIRHEKHYLDQPPPVAFPPLVPYGTTFPPLSGGTIKHREALSPQSTLS